MADATEILPQFFTGGAISSEADVETLVAMGITADIDCRLEYDDQSVIDEYAEKPNAKDALEAHPKIAYLYNGVADDKQPKPAAWFQRSWEFAEPILKSGGVVLAHCAAGVNRGPSTCYFLMRAYLGMSGDEAYSLIVHLRPVAEVGYRQDADEAIVTLGLGK